MFERSPPDWLEFIYLDYYRRFAKREIPDEVERAFESAIVADPRIGVVVPGLGGLRKVRVALPGHGKRGGARFLYFLRLASGRVYVVTAYAKSVQADLTPDQRRLIRQLRERLE
jgi:hypothetical protein